jgi:arylsulfatase A-like enzyme
MKQVIYFLILLSFLAACQQNKDRNAREKGELPNIVLIVGDDHGYPYFGFMGADYMETPSMDKLAAGGLVFTDGYVPSNHCKPSLQSLMTGTMPVQYENVVNAMMGKELEKEENQGLSGEKKKELAREFRYHAMQHF